MVDMLEVCRKLVICLNSVVSKAIQYVGCVRGRGHVSRFVLDDSG